VEYRRTKDTLHVMQVLEHRRIQNTLKYTQPVHFEALDNYVCKVAKIDQEIGALIELSFEYVCENQVLKFFRKPK